MTSQAAQVGMTRGSFEGRLVAQVLLLQALLLIKLSRPGSHSRSNSHSHSYSHPTYSDELPHQRQEQFRLERSQDDMDAGVGLSSLPPIHFGIRKDEDRIVYRAEERYDKGQSGKAEGESREEGGMGRNGVKATSNQNQRQQPNPKQNQNQSQRNGLTTAEVKAKNSPLDMKILKDVGLFLSTDTVSTGSDRVRVYRLINVSTSHPSRLF